MSCIAYIALHNAAPELLLSVFFSGRRDVALERSVVGVARDEWRAEREVSAGGAMRRNNNSNRAARDASGAIELQHSDYSSEQQTEAEKTDMDITTTNSSSNSNVSLQEQLVVVWHSPASAPNLCHALLCRAATANTALALQTLQALHSVLAEQHKSVESVFAVKPDEVLLVLERLLPSGCMLALTGSLVKHLKREADVSAAK